MSLIPIPASQVSALELQPLFEVEELELRLESAWSARTDDDGTVIIDSPV